MPLAYTLSLKQPAYNNALKLGLTVIHQTLSNIKVYFHLGLV